MNTRIFLLMITATLCCLSIGCSQTNSANLSLPTADNQTKDVEPKAPSDHKWLNYADPKADANLAIEKQDFKLLAFAGRVTSFPGLDNNSTAPQQQCGFRLLANSGDTLQSPNELSERKKLYQYAATYNQLVAAACQRSHQNN